MLGPGRYLQGAVELIWLVGFAWLGAAGGRRRRLGEVDGEAGFLATAVVAIALLIWIAELLGTGAAFKPVPYLIAMAVVGGGLWLVVRDAHGRDAGGGGGPRPGRRGRRDATSRGRAALARRDGHRPADRRDRVRTLRQRSEAAA